MLSRSLHRIVLVCIFVLPTGKRSTITLKQILALLSFRGMVPAEFDGGAFLFLQYGYCSIYKYFQRKL